MDPEGSSSHSQQPATCSYPEPDQSSPFPCETSRRSILLLFSRLRIGLPSGFFRQGFSINPCKKLSSLHTCHVPRPSHYFQFCHCNCIRCGLLNMKLLIMQSSPVPCYLLPSQVQVSSSTPCSRTPSAYITPPIQNNKQNDVSVQPCSLPYPVEHFQFPLCFPGFCVCVCVCAQCSKWPHRFPFRMHVSARKYWKNFS